MFKLRSSWAIQGLLNLHTILDATAHLKATDHRDRIFAMLGLVNQPPGDQIKADYNKSAQDVFKEVTKTPILRENGVDSLSMILNRPKNHDIETGLPSWASDWGPMPTMPLFGRRPCSGDLLCLWEKFYSTLLLRQFECPRHQRLLFRQCQNGEREESVPRSGAIHHHTQALDRHRQCLR